MAQSSITNYFNKRKRPTVEDVKMRSKVLVLSDQDSSFLKNNSGSQEEGSKIISYGGEPVFIKKTILSQPKQRDAIEKHEGTHNLGKSVESRKIISGRLTSSVTKKNSKTGPAKSNLSNKQSDIRESFKKVNVDNLPKGQEVPDTVRNKGLDIEQKSAGPTEKTAPLSLVPFELKGTLSPKKIKPDGSPSSTNRLLGSAQSHKSEADVGRKELGLMTPKRRVPVRKEDLTLNQIKSKLSRSSRLAELRESIKTFNKCSEQLDKLVEQRRALDSSLSPKLKEFNAIEVEVPVTPQKEAAAASSEPLLSPRKGPAYQSYSPLAKPGLPALSLPYTYRFLAEVFRCTDTVTSMLHNRKETVTFNKLKPAVQEMLRRNFTENHLGQIKKVHSELYSFKQEKRRAFGSSKPETYELVVEPQFAVKTEDKNADHSMMTPSCLLERRRAFHAKLLEIIKDHHDEFLLSLDPPMAIPRTQLTRWHPEFEVEKVPCIEADPLPQPPTAEKYTTAKDVLDRAKTLFNCNHRMEKALQKANEQLSGAVPTTPTKESRSNPEPSTSPLLKGLPKSLVEKIRAKQAAKAMLAMTRTPVEEQEAIQYLRLPEMARILRNLYVAEKKSVLPLEWVLEKLGCSYRERLSRAELETHIRLIMKLVPGWLETYNIRKADFLRLSKAADMAAVLKKLEETASQKNDDR